MRRSLRTSGLLVATAVLLCAGLWGSGGKEAAVSAHAEGPAPVPPMGWNSYQAYWGDVTEQEVRGNANFMSQHMASYGWKYVVIDYYWYYSRTVPHAQGEALDDYARLMPAPNRFPSAAHGQGFKPLADYVHSKGLKFGIHIMRGIPRAAVEKNLPILGTAAHAHDIADPGNSCSWSRTMYGVDVTKPAGQAYYDSLVALYAQWGVDYIKADDMSWEDTPQRENYHGAEIAALHCAIMKSGLPIVLSLSPGPAPLDRASHLEENAQLWRISEDMWDKWKLLKNQFVLCRAWAPYIGPNHWPDADLIPLGRISIHGVAEPARQSRLTPAEQQTLLTLWTIFRSPLMIGGDLRGLDAATLARLTNNEVLSVDQNSSHNHEIFTHGSQVAWVADSPTGSKYLALFNLDDQAPAMVTVRWNELGLGKTCQVRDLWERKDLGAARELFSPQLPPHGAGLYRVAAAQ